MTPERTDPVLYHINGDVCPLPGEMCVLSLEGVEGSMRSYVDMRSGSLPWGERRRRTRIYLPNACFFHSLRGGVGEFIGEEYLF